MSNNTTVVVDAGSRPGFPGPLEFVASAWRQRQLIRKLTRRQIASRYKGSVLGVLWAFIVPLMMLAVFTFVFSVVFKIRWGVDVEERGQFALVLFSGLIVFNLFNHCVTHLRSRSTPFFRDLSDQDLREQYGADFRQVFGCDFNPRWSQVNRVPMYSPVLVRGYRNSPIRSTAFGKLYFAGNFRTFPSVVSIGTALMSGLETAATLMSATRTPCDVLQRAKRYRAPAGLMRQRSASDWSAW